MNKRQLITQMQDTELGKLKHFSKFVSSICSLHHVGSTEPITQRKKEDCAGTKGPYATMGEGGYKGGTVTSHDMYTGPRCNSESSDSHRQTNSNGNLGVRLSLFLS